MKSLTETKPALLEWRREAGPGLAYKLQMEDGTAASLVFPDRWNVLAKVETAEGNWTIKHLGLLNPITTLREEGDKRNLAVFHPHALRHGKLEFADGAVFDWATLHDGAPGGAFLDFMGIPMVRIHARPAVEPKPGMDLDSGMVELGQAPKARWRHAILAAFGWYILLMDHYKEFPEHAAEFSLRM
jgi:hypothetical protein